MVSNLTSPCESHEGLGGGEVPQRGMGNFTRGNFFNGWWEPEEE